MKQTLWCCVKKSNYDWTALSYKRTDSIKSFMQGSLSAWQQWKSKGWKCIKVEVEIKPLNEVK